MRLQLSQNFLTCWILKEKSSQLMRWGCQKDIAEKIQKQGGDYLFAVKGNQGRLNKAFEEKFPLKELNNPEHDSYAISEKSHGREEIRLHIVCDVPDELIDFTFEWKGL
ncbi:transposase DDE domain protein, partial [Escherichia coli Tx3800]